MKERRIAIKKQTVPEFRKSLEERSNLELRALRAQFDRDDEMDREMYRQFVELEQQRRRNMKGF